TITQFIKERFNNPAATAAVLAVIVFTAGMSIPAQRARRGDRPEHDFWYSATSDFARRSGNRHHLLLFRRSLDFRCHRDDQHAPSEYSRCNRHAVRPRQGWWVRTRVREGPVHWPAIFRSGARSH